MRNHGWLLYGVLAVLALRSFGATAQGDDDDDDDRGPGGRGDTTCTRTLGDVQIRGSLNIASRCELNGTDVRGNVTLFEGGSLIARNARIRGRLEGRRADFVTITRTRIDGAVDLQGLVGDESTISRSDLRNEVALTGNRSRFEVLNNELRRSLRAVGNLGGLVIAGNSIERDLECSGNRPAPTGLGNRVEGDAEGQCASLRPEATAPEPEPEPDPQPSPPRTPTPTPTPTPTTPAPATPPPAAPPPATSTPPPASTPTPSPPAATPAPAPSLPESSSPPPPATPAPAPPADDSLADEGGAGAVGWPIALLLLALRLLPIVRRRRV